MAFYPIPRKAVEGYAKRFRETEDAQALESAGELGRDPANKCRRCRRVCYAEGADTGYLDALEDMGVNTGLIIMEGEALAMGEPGLPRLVVVPAGKDD